MTARAALTLLLLWALVASAVGVIAGSIIVRASDPTPPAAQLAGPLPVPSGMTTERVSPLPSPDKLGGRGSRTELERAVTPAPTSDGATRRITTSSSKASGPVAATMEPRTAVSLRGIATWYRYVEGQAAAGPALRAALGLDWRGRTVVVRVAPGGPRLAVVLTDWCQCGDRDERPTLIDLDRRDFARLAPPSWGVLDVEVTW